jgi:hypothetical protein
MHWVWDFDELNSFGAAASAAAVPAAFAAQN